MTDVEALKKCISESGMTVVFIASKAGILRETLYNRMNSAECDFKASEISALTKVLGLSKERRDAIFFANESELKSHKSNELPRRR